MKTKIRIFKFLIFPLAMALGILSCEKDADFITEVPNTFYTLDNAFSTAGQVDAAVIACYQHTRNIYWPNHHTAYTLKGKGTDVIDVPLLRIGSTLSDYSRNDPETSEFNAVYSTFYQLISKANTALYAAELEHIQWGS